MVVADDEGNLFEHPELEMVGAQGTEPVAPEPEELSPLPGGSKFFTIPDSIPVGGDPEEDALVSVEEADWGDGAAALTGRLHVSLPRVDAHPAPLRRERPRGAGTPPMGLHRTRFR